MLVLFSNILYPLENKTSIEYIKYFKSKIILSPITGKLFYLKEEFCRAIISVHISVFNSIHNVCVGCN